MRSGFPGSSSRWSPTLNVPHARPSVAACSQAGLSTMRLVLVRMPSRCAWMMPRLTPLVMPKSSAVTMSHLIGASFLQRRAERREVKVPIHELLRGPLGVIVQEREGNEEDAMGMARCFGRMQQQVQLSNLRKMPARTRHGLAIPLHDPRPLLG